MAAVSRFGLRPTEPPRAYRPMCAPAPRPASLGPLPASIKAADGVITASVVPQEMAAADHGLAAVALLATPADVDLMAGILR